MSTNTMNTEGRYWTNYRNIVYVPRPTSVTSWRYQLNFSVSKYNKVARLRWRPSWRLYKIEAPQIVYEACGPSLDCKLLPEVGQGFCYCCKSFDFLDEKESDLAMGPLSTAHFSTAEGGIMRSTNSEVPRPQPTINSGNKCLRHRCWRCTNARLGKGTSAARIFK